VAALLGFEHRRIETDLSALLDRARKVCWLTDGMLSAWVSVCNLDYEIIRREADVCYGGHTLFGLFYAPPEAAPEQIVEQRFRHLASRQSDALLEPTWLDQVRQASLDYLRQDRSAQADSALTPAERFVIQNEQLRCSAMGTVVQRHFLCAAQPLVDDPCLDALCALAPDLRHGRQVYELALCRIDPAAAAVPEAKTGVGFNASPRLRTIGRCWRGSLRVASRFARRHFGLRLGWDVFAHLDIAGRLARDDRQQAQIRELLCGRDSRIAELLPNSAIQAVLERVFAGRTADWSDLSKLITMEYWFRLFVT